MKRGEKMSPEQRAIRSLKARGNMRAVGHKVTAASKLNLKRGTKPGPASQGARNADGRRATPPNGRQERAA